MKNFYLKTIICLFCTILFVSPCSATLTQQDAKAVWGKIEMGTGLKLPITFSDKTVPNAWVTNGEKVTVTKGLLDLLQSKNELFGVLGHEAGHAVLGHHKETRKRAIGLGILSVLVDKMTDNDFAKIGVNVGSNLVYSGWSRGEEVEADDFSVELAYKMGVDPVGLYMALMRLSKIHKTEPSGFNSHPPDERRLLHIRNKIRSLDPDCYIPETLPKPKLKSKVNEKISNRSSEEHCVDSTDNTGKS